MYDNSNNVKNFIKRLKSRRDPIPTIPERLQFHASSMQTLAKSCSKGMDYKLGSALNFLSNQIFNWIDKCTEYHKLPNFVPSVIRMALLIRNQSRLAYTVSKISQFISILK